MKKHDVRCKKNHRNTTDTPKKVLIALMLSITSTKAEWVKDVISKRKAYLLSGKKQWTYEKIDKSRDETINKIYAQCKQHKLKEAIKLGKS